MESQIAENSHVRECSIEQIGGSRENMPREDVQRRLYHGACASRATTATAACMRYYADGGLRYAVVCLYVLPFAADAVVAQRRRFR